MGEPVKRCVCGAWYYQGMKCNYCGRDNDGNSDARESGATISRSE